MDEDDHTAGYRAGKQWIVESQSEIERANLAAEFAGGATQIVVGRDLYPTLLKVLGAEPDAREMEVDFGATRWLIGFRDAIIEELAEPG